LLHQNFVRKRVAYRGDVGAVDVLDIRSERWQRAKSGSNVKMVLEKS